MVLPDRDGVPMMPNMMSLVANAPHPEEGRRLIDYLLSPMSSASSQNQRQFRFRCTRCTGAEEHAAIETFKPMTLDFAKAASRVEDVTTRLATILGL